MHRIAAPPYRPFIKICCISSHAEAQLAISAGASALGLVSSMPSGPGVIDDKNIADIAASIPPPIATFLLTAQQDANAIIAQHQVCRTSTIQLVDHVPHTELLKLRKHLAGIKLVQVIHVSDKESVNEALGVASLVDALLLDSGNPKQTIKELGGTGRTHDWSLSRLIRASSPVPVFLAGGLSATNVSTAIATVAPFGLDLCSSIRTEGKLDSHKLHSFMTAVSKSRHGVHRTP